MIRPTCNKIHKSYSVRHVVAGKVGSPYNDQVPIIQMDINIKSILQFIVMACYFVIKGYTYTYRHIV